MLTTFILGLTAFGTFEPAIQSPEARTEQISYQNCTQASWYGPGLYGNRTANGEIYTGNSHTAAHRSLPFGTRVRVTNRHNGRSVVVRINDRGPFVGGRGLDLSRAAARSLGVSGVSPVCYSVM